MIEISSLKKQYKEQVVLDIPELVIQRKTCFGLVGNNGAGKTTLFRTILDLIRPTSGKVLINGVDVAREESWKRFVGAYLDEHMLLTYLTPDEYFRVLGRLYGMSEADVLEHLAPFETFLNDEIIGKKKYLRDLSKGNIKKVGIVAALMGNPELILLDEPFENLDPSSQVHLKRLIGHFIDSGNKTFLISSHDLAHVTDLCDRIVLLEKGRILKDLQEKAGMVDELNAYFGT
ncbi:ABC transporter [Nitritalea halalkaliphila LW7]|uniref:ABC transporter n=1 Tax=Nitritalea halalkaliphila LW7 TaxID=1189621 RepID=I5C0R3_9BACT|nr:ABC transporter ATP-binding protein [Nitritalea halalkaliphila]EIM75415.1 ABC transporter [Nitritalea halalkaliphila LW7]